MSPSAMPRTTTVAVCVVPMPPIDATIGMNTARVARVWIDPSKSPMTDAASMAVPRLISRQMQTAREDLPRRIEHGLVARHAAEPLDVLGGLLVDDVDDVVDADPAEQAPIAVDHGHFQRRRSARRAAPLPPDRCPTVTLSTSSVRIARIGVAGSAVTSRCTGTTPTRCSWSSTT